MSVIHIGNGLSYAMIIFGILSAIARGTHPCIAMSMKSSWLRPFSTSHCLETVH